MFPSHLFYDFIISSRRLFITDTVKYGKRTTGSKDAHQQQMALIKADGSQQQQYHPICHCRVQQSPRQGQQKYHFNLLSNGAADFLIAESHLLHNFEVFLILKAFGNLFIIHNYQKTNQKD